MNDVILECGIPDDISVQKSDEILAMLAIKSNDKETSKLSNTFLSNFCHRNYYYFLYTHQDQW